MTPVQLQRCRQVCFAFGVDVRRRYPAGVSFDPLAAV